MPLLYIIRMSAGIRYPSCTFTKSPTTKLDVYTYISFPYLTMIVFAGTKSLKESIKLSAFYS